MDTKKKPKKLFTFRLPFEVVERLKIIAEKEDRSLSYVVEKALKSFMVNANEQ